MYYERGRHHLCGIYCSLQQLPAVEGLRNLGRSLHVVADPRGTKPSQKTEQVGSRAPPTEGFWNSSYPGGDAFTVLIQKRYLTEETDTVPARVLARIATWRRLTEAERVSRLRECIVDEVVGNMCMEGQPVSAAWGAIVPADQSGVEDQRVGDHHRRCHRSRGQHPGPRTLTRACYSHHGMPWASIHSR